MVSTWHVKRSRTNKKRGEGKFPDGEAAEKAFISIDAGIDPVGHRMAGMKVFATIWVR